MKIKRELLNKYLVRDIEGKDESIYIFPRVIEIDMDVKEDTERNTNEDNNDTNNGEQVIASNTNSA